MSYFPPTWAGPQMAGPYSPLPLQGGLGGLGANPLSQLPRGLAGGLTPLPSALNGMVQGGGLASQVPAGAGAEALSAANALRGGAAASSGAGGLAAQAGRFAAPVLTRGSLMRGAGYGLLGSVGSGVIDQLNPGGQNSNVEQALQGAAQGAGLGAGIGSIFPGIGTGVGAAVGGVAGGALGILGNTFGWGGDGGKEEEANPVDIIGNAMRTANLDPGTTEQILTTYETLMALAEGQEGDAKKAAQQAAFDQTAQMVLSAVGQQESVAQSVPNTLALQQQASQIFEPLAQDIEANAAMYAQAMQGIRGTLPESLRGIADYKSAGQLSSANRLANAYRAQAAITPTVDQLTQYQRDQQNYAAQLFSQQMAQQAAGASGGGASSQDVLAALQG